ncbi:MAG: hypothetical protein ACJ716_06070 [Marmoricola sp.]
MKLASRILQLITAAGLAFDARIHLRLAPAYDQVKSSTVSQGDLFRIEAWLAIAAAVLVVVLRRPATAALAALVAGGGLVPLLAYRYHDFGSLGPLPSMYEPAWYPDKTHTAIAQAIAAGTAVVLLVLLVLEKRKSAAGPIPTTDQREEHL